MRMRLTSTHHYYCISFLNSMLILLTIINIMGLLHRDAFPCLHLLRAELLVQVILAFARLLHVRATGIEILAAPLPRNRESMHLWLIVKTGWRQYNHFLVLRQKNVCQRRTKERSI